MLSAVGNTHAKQIEATWAECDKHTLGITDSWICAHWQNEQPLYFRKPLWSSNDANS